jgi:hypothetical protein
MANARQQAAETIAAGSRGSGGSHALAGRQRPAAAPCTPSGTGRRAISVALAPVSS